jgi:hypothetical protein
MLQVRPLLGMVILGVLASTAAADPAPPAPAASALRSPGMPMNGVIRKLEGARLTLELADGSLTTLLLAPHAVLTSQQKAAFSDIKPNDFVASAGILGQDGRTHAQEVRIFPESMRGAGEGHTPMSLPNQTMTNATVASVSASMTNATVSNVGAGVLTTVYPGGSTEIVVDPDTPVWSIVTVDREQLAPGSHVVAFVTKDPNGNLTARYVGLK